MPLGSIHNKLGLIGLKIMSAILNFGSINIDYVYRVPHLVEPGETLASLDLSVVLGGKGANQSVALARAGVDVSHIGRLSRSDRWAAESLRDMGVDTQYVELIDDASGHAIIQVDQSGENAIVLHGGANQSFDLQSLEKTLKDASNSYTYLLMQNECNLLAEVVELANSLNCKIALNPAPMTNQIKSLPLTQIDTLIVNEIEARELTGQSEHQSVIDTLAELSPNSQIVLTLGVQGALLLHQGNITHAASPKVDVVDTTGAGDTFVGYFLAGCVAGLSAEVSLKRACSAASVAVTRQGATPSIPFVAELGDLAN